MFSHFAFAANAVFPILILILLGYLLRRFSFFNDEFLKICNKLVFYVLLPAMLFMSLYHVESISNIDWKAVLYTGGVIIFLFLAGIAIVAIFIRDRRQKGVVLQAVFRSNTALIGLPLAQALGGVQKYVSAWLTRNRDGSNRFGKIYSALYSQYKAAR